MVLKEIKLTSLDYFTIQQNAIRLWIDNTPKDSYNYNTICIVQSFVDYTIANKLVVKDGKVYKDEETKSS